MGFLTVTEDRQSLCGCNVW